jgi:hypothetical protein
MVLAWIDGLERRPDIAQNVEDIIADQRFAPGQIIMFSVLRLKRRRLR